jgi:hypothetical protein
MRIARFGVLGALGMGSIVAYAPGGVVHVHLC